VAVAHALSPESTKRPYSDPDAPCEGNIEAVADGFAVVTLSEALQLRESGILQPVLVLQGPQRASDCEYFEQYDLWPVIHDLDQYAWYESCAEVKKLNAWLKIDTGMGRLGVSVAQATKLLRNHDAIHWQGMLTHFACADEVDNPFTRQQIEAFASIAPDVKIDRSLANSAAVLAWPDARSDWARPGIMLYGCNPLDRELPEGVTLKPAMSVSAPLISVKRMPAGTGIGYAQTYHCPEDMPVGYVGLGYRDGIPRVLDGRATVTIAGVRCPIIGRVSMDSFAVDLRPAPAAKRLDSATLWGSDTSIDDLASAAGTINYELLTSIRGHRRYMST